MGLVLKLKDVTKRFRGFTLDTVSFGFPAGYIMGLVGPNGSGKTTIIKLIMNLLTADGGEIELFGLNSIEHELEVKQKIGFVYDESPFFEDLTMRDMTRIISPFYKNWDQNIYRDYMKRFNLLDNQKIKTLSKGMKMKYALVVALSHDAELLILDEPTSGLDPLIRNELLDILSEVIQDGNCSILFSTHITSDLDRLADYVTLINGGDLVFSKSREDLQQDYALISGESSLLGTELRTHLVGYKENQFGFEGLVRQKHELRVLMADKAVLSTPTIEDIMVYKLGGKRR